jgi:hypothetical protein
MYYSLYFVVLAVVLAVPGTSLVNPRNVPCNLRHTTLTARSELEPCGKIDGKQSHVGRSMSFRRSKYIDMSRPKNTSCSPKSDSETTTVPNTMTRKEGKALSPRFSELQLESAQLQETLETLGRGLFSSAGAGAEEEREDGDDYDDEYDTDYYTDYSTDIE